MNYTIKIGNDINTADIDSYYPLLYFGVYQAKDWKKNTGKIYLYRSGFR